MTRYIDADDFNNNFRGELCENIDCENCSFHIPSYYCKLANYLNNYETSDVKPVVHAHWIDTYGHSLFECSACECEFSDSILLLDHTSEFPNYCPNCGAIMDEAVNNG